MAEGGHATKQFRVLVPGDGDDIECTPAGAGSGRYTDLEACHNLPVNDFLRRHFDKLTGADRRVVGHPSR